MVSHLIQGSNEAESLLRNKGQTNHGNKMEWISNTNNRGAPGHRESHAEGDSVGEDDRAHHSFGGFIKGVGKGIGNVAKGAYNHVIKPVAKTVAPLAGAVAPMAIKAGMKYAGLNEGGQPRQGHAGGQDIAYRPYADGQDVQGNQIVCPAVPSQQPIEHQQQMKCGGRARSHRRG